MEFLPIHEDQIHVSVRGKVSSWSPWWIYALWTFLNHIFFRFSIEIETYYTSDGGHQENLFHLSNSDARNRVVDLIDVVKDQVECVVYRHAKKGESYVGCVNSFLRPGRGITQPSHRLF